MLRVKYTLARPAVVVLYYVMIVWPISRFYTISSPHALTQGLRLLTQVTSIKSVRVLWAPGGKPQSLHRKLLSADHNHFIRRQSVFLSVGETKQQQNTNAACKSLSNVLVSSACLQILVFCFYLHLTQHPNFFGLKFYLWSNNHF